jgi:hypothetical protein
VLGVEIEHVKVTEEVTEAQVLDETLLRGGREDGRPDAADVERHLLEKIGMP